METLFCKAEEILEDRAGHYLGYPTEAERIALIWTGVTGYDIQAFHVPLMMAGMKLMREGGKHKRDNLIDIAGYVELADRMNGRE